MASIASLERCLDAVFRRLEILHLAHGPREGPLFYLWLSINCGIG
jgi:hypothetical protein